MQLLVGASLIDVDFILKDDRALLSGAQKRTWLCSFKFSLSTFCFRGAEVAAHVIFLCIFSSTIPLAPTLQCLLSSSPSVRLPVKIPVKSDKFCGQRGDVPHQAVLRTCLLCCSLR